MVIQEVVIQVVVILAFGIWIYSKIKHQSIKDTIIEIRDAIIGIVKSS